MAKPRVKIQLLVFMSEIKINLTSEKIKFSDSFTEIREYGKITYFSTSAVTTENFGGHFFSYFLIDGFAFLLIYQTIVHDVPSSLTAESI